MTYETLLFILPRTTAPMKNCSKWEIGKKETYYIITFFQIYCIRVPQTYADRIQYFKFKKRLLIRVAKRW